MLKRLLGGSARERRLRTASAIAFAFGMAFAVWVLLLDPLSSVQKIAADAQARAQDGSPNIVIVGIDEPTLERFGRIEEMERATHASVIDALSEAGANVIVFDILFADRSADPAADEPLAESIAGAGNVVLAAAGQGSPDLEDTGAIYSSILPPTDAFVDAGAVVAAANLYTDGDGRVRSLPLAVYDAKRNELPAMTLAATYMQFGREPPSPVPFEGGELDLFGRTVPLENGRIMRINFAGGIDRFTYLSYVDIFDGGFEPSAVSGKIVLVGLVATAADVHSVPLMGSAHGIEVHANALDTILNARFLTPVGDSVTFALMLLFVVAAALTVPRWRLAFSFAGVIGVIVVYVLVGNLLYNSGEVIDFVNPPVALAVATVSALAYREVAERSSRRETQDLFGRYVSPQVARELIERADHGDLALGGELREVTVLFGDIRGFTPLSTQMPPQELVSLLNRHFDVIIARIMENGGIVNKFVGDAVMALWNAPEDQPNHALLACRAAMQAQRDLIALDESGRVVRWGFGINTGTVVAGNVGSGRRQEYTVIGDPVNRAARLCGIAPAGEVWIGDATYQIVKDRIASEALPAQTIKGIDTPVHPHKLLDETLGSPAQHEEAQHEEEEVG